jgi:hypothetical protein
MMFDPISFIILLFPLLGWFGSKKKEAKKAEAALWTTQCYLAENLSSFVKANRDAGKTKQYANFFTLSGPEAEIPGKLAQTLGDQLLLDMTPAQQAALVPRIRIFKVHYDKETQTKPTSELELKFNDFLSLNDVSAMIESHRGRGGGSGIKSFEWEDLGGNQAEAGAVFRAKLSMFFQTMEDFVGSSSNMEDRKSLVKRGIAQPIDLLMQVGKMKPAVDADGKRLSNDRPYNPKFFTIKVSAGWAVPDHVDDTVISPDLKAAIRNSKIDLLLTLKRHTINMNQDGSLTVDLEYTAGVEASMRTPGSDLFWMTKDERSSKDASQQEIKNETEELKTQKKERKEKEKKEGEKDKDARKDEKETAKELKEKREDLADKQWEDLAKKYGRLLERIKAPAKGGGSKIWFVDVQQDLDVDGNPTGKLKQAGSGGSTPSPAPSGTKGSDDAVKEALKSSSETETKDKKERTKIYQEAVTKMNTAVDAVAEGSKRINYIYFGDLLDAALDTLYAKGNPFREDAKFILGSITYVDPKSKKKTRTNLGDIPIALDNFQAWWVKKTAQAKRPNYFLQAFIRDIISELIFRSLGEDCFESLGRKTPTVTFRPFTVERYRIPGFSGKDTGGHFDVKDIKAGGTSRGSTGKSSAGNAKEEETSDLVGCVLVFVSSNEGALMKGDPEDDMRRGIPHFFIGRDKGIVKTISFAKEDDPAIETAMVTRDAGSLGVQQLRGLYNVNISMYGNTLLKNGQYIYVDPTTSGVGDPQKRASLARELGLGGYFLITKVENVVDLGKFETNITARHEGFGTTLGGGTSKDGKAKEKKPGDNPEGKK